MTTEGESWSEYQLMVLKELQYHHESLETVKIELGLLRVELAKITMVTDRVAELERQMKIHDTEIAMLRVKAGMWGAAAGILTGIAAALVSLVK